MRSKRESQNTRHWAHPAEPGHDGGIWLLIVTLATLLGSSLGMPIASAQVATPDQQISRLNALQGQPVLSANGSRVFGTWFGGEGSGNTSVGYGYSLDRGATWANETGFPIQPPFNSVTVPAFGCLDDNGTVRLITDYNGVQYFKGTGFSPINWGSPKVALDVYTTNFAGYDNHVVASDPALGYVYLCATQRTDPAYDYVVLFSRSVDDGATWPVPISLSGPSCNGSSMAVALDGTIFVSWLDYALGQVLLRKSTDHGASFGPAVVVADMLDNLAARPPHWLPPYSTGYRSYPTYRPLGGAPNFPALAVDRSSTSSRGNLYLTWAEHAPGTVAPASTTVGDAGNNDTFATAQLVPMNCDINGSLCSVEFGCFDTDVYAFDGLAGQTIWIAGTAFGSPSAGTTWFLDEALPTGGTLQLNAQSIFNPLRLPTSERTKPTIWTLPHTGRYYLSLHSTPIAMNYTLNLRSYIPTPGALVQDMRDVLLVRSTDGGATWGPKVRVNHDPPGADQGMSNVAVDGTGRVYVGWYDRRGFALGDSVNAYAAVSQDAGQTFGPDLRLSSAPSSWSGPEAATKPGELIGDRIAIAAGDNYGIVAWTDLRDWYQDSNIYAARIIDLPTAVDAVSDLSAEPVAEGVRLSWHVNDVRAVSGLRVFRALLGEDEVALGRSDIVPTREGALDYLDASAEPGHTYDYRLQIRSGGLVDWLGPVTVQVPARIATLAWRAAWPNPFARRTTIKLAVPRAADGAVRVYDVQGKEVRTLAAGHFVPGERDIEWDGRDASGGTAAAGLYFVTAQVGGERTQLRVARVP